MRNGFRGEGSDPVDVAHLSRQTMGDRALEREVLAMFADHLAGLRAQLAAAGEGERRQLAHTLKGAARSIGAFALADCAEEIEREPMSEALRARLAALADGVREFIAARQKQ